MSITTFIQEYEALCQKHGYFIAIDNSGEMGTFLLAEPTQNFLDAIIIKLKEDAANES